MSRAWITTFVLACATAGVGSAGCGSDAVRLVVLAGLVDEATNPDGGSGGFSDHPGDTNPGSSTDIGSADGDDATAGFERGVALIPANLPFFDDDDVHDMLARTERVGAGIAILSWDDASMLETADIYAKWGRKNGVPIMLAINPTSIASRSDLIVPAELRSSGSSSASFVDDAIREAFLRDSVALAALRPRYLGLATEVNFLADGNPDEFAAFVELYKAAYRQVKAVSPQTQVFVSFYWDSIYVEGRRAGGFHVDSALVINAFRPELDVLALTTYPAGFWARPSNIPSDFYQTIDRYRLPGERLVIMEIGWPSEEPGSRVEQVAFVRRLPTLFDGVSVDFLGWSLLHDVPDSLLESNLATTGLIDIRGTEKPAWDAFLSLSVGG